LTARERGFLLLTSQLGDPQRRPLTVAQLRTLAQRVRSVEAPRDRRQMQPRDLMIMGYSEAEAERILQLLSDKELLEYYLHRGKKAGCLPLTRVSEAYPPSVRKKLGLDSPGCLWAKGDASLLATPCVALVGSRDLLPENRAFAAEVGRQAARQGLTLVSGNARGADRTAQKACLAAGGRVIIVVADRLEEQRESERVLYLSEDGFDLGFSALRALSRNRIIHSLGEKTFVAQSSLGIGGTWNGTCNNLKLGLSSVYCFHDGSAAARELEQMGAIPVQWEDLEDIGALRNNQTDFFGQ